MTFKRLVRYKSVSLCLVANISLKPCVLFAARKFMFQINGRWWINKTVEFVTILSVHFECMSLILICQRPIWTAVNYKIVSHSISQSLASLSLWRARFHSWNICVDFRFSLCIIIVNHSYCPTNALNYTKLRG